MTTELRDLERRRLRAPWSGPTSPPRRRRSVGTVAGDLVSAYADTMRTVIAWDDGGGVVEELAAVREARRDVTRREEVAVRRARNAGLSWAEIGTLLGVTRQTVHRKYKVG